MFRWEQAYMPGWAKGIFHTKVEQSKSSPEAEKAIRHGTTNEVHGVAS